MTRALFLLTLWLFIDPTSAQDCLVDYELRLVQTPSLTASNSGRLEVCRDGRWGSVRDTSRFWPQKNVLVACEYLNYPAGLNSIPSIQLRDNDQAGPDVPVHMVGVSCDGTEWSLRDCLFSIVTNSTLHGSDVYIVCLPGPEGYSGSHSALVREGDVRLKGSESNGRGAVEIYTRLGWSSICPDSSWTSFDAGVICWNLGYESGVTEIFPVDPTLMESRKVYDAQCGQPSEEFNLFRVTAGDCTFQFNDPSLCSAVTGSYAGVSCSTASTTGSVRLFSRTTEGERVRGIVEVLIDSRWGLVCRPFAEEEAGSAEDPAALQPVDETVLQSTCEGLGYSRRMSVYYEANLQAMESRLKPIWYPDVVCSEETSSFSECRPGSPVGYGNCTQILAVDCHNPSRSLSGGSIAGIVIGVLVCVGVCTFFALTISQKRSK